MSVFLCADRVFDTHNEIWSSLSIRRPTAKLIDELAELRNRAVEEQRVAADRARREAKKARERELRQQIAEFRRRELARTIAFKQEMALRDLEARARIGRRTLYYPVRNDYSYPRINYFYGVPYSFYRVPLLGFYYPGYHVNYGTSHHRFVVTHHRGHHHKHH